MLIFHEKGFYTKEEIQTLIGHGENQMSKMLQSIPAYRKSRTYWYRGKDIYDYLITNLEWKEK